MLRVVIAEDNRHERLILKKMLSRIPGLTVEGEAENGVELINMVEVFKPQIVFLDIEMPEANGFESASAVAGINPKTFIVFATAHEDYAKEAFDACAFDFITKPYSYERLVQTIDRVKAIIGDFIKYDRELGKKLEISRPNEGPMRQRLVIQTEDGMIFVKTADIIMITKTDRKTEIHTTSGIYKVNEPMEKIESKLGSSFFRSHKGYIINTDMMLELTAWGSKTFLVKLSNTKETALMTFESLRLFKQLYCIE